jgi:hypothetical protein
MDRNDQEAEYARQKGQAALERQKRLAKEECPNCGFKRPSHHPMCVTQKGVRK